MKYRQLGASKISLSEIGFGCASYWGKKVFPEKKAIELVHIAVEKGVTLFDTGHSYSNGNAELRLGKALSGVSLQIDLCISTKAGTRIASNGSLYNDFSPAWIARSCQQSLLNLNIKQIGVFHLHGPNIEDLNDDLYELLLKLKQKGLVKALAINAFDEAIIRHATASKVFDCVMLDYNILSQQREKLINDLYAQNIAIMAAAPLAGSLYSNRIFKLRGLKDLWYLARAVKNSSANIFKGRKYKFINKYQHYTGAQVALAFVLNNPKISCAVFGSTSSKHLLENLEASELDLSNEMLRKIRQV